jgi:hypothetical protein
VTAERVRRGNREDDVGDGDERLGCSLDQLDALVQAALRRRAQPAVQGLA